MIQWLSGSTTVPFILGCNRLFLLVCPKKREKSVSGNVLDRKLTAGHKLEISFLLIDVSNKLGWAVRVNERYSDCARPLFVSIQSIVRVYNFGGLGDWKGGAGWKGKNMPSSWLSTQWKHQHTHHPKLLQ